MIIFYPAVSDAPINPIVIMDALDSSDRYSDAEVKALVLKNVPSGVNINILALASISIETASVVNDPSIFSCTYDFEFSHNSIPLGEGIKTQFIGSISSPPAALVAQFSPKYFTSAQSLDQMSNAFSKIANPQTTITHAALVVRDQNNNYISRKFITYAAQVQPDPYGSTTTMIIHGASIDDILIKSEVAFMLDKKLPLMGQLSSMLSKAGYTAVFGTFAVYDNPVSDKLFQPMSMRELLDEICLQNKLVYKIEDKVVTFYSQTDKPLDATKSEFSFLGYKGALAWAVGVENYANIKFKTSYFDARLFQPITIYNDIKSAFFAGLNASGNAALVSSFLPIAPLSYDASIIRYVLRRTPDEIVAEVTATNNWLLSQMRIDGILQASVYVAAL
jgi:hypothetical protein